MQRRRLVARLDRDLPPCPEVEGVRRVDPGDALPLAGLMLAAYRGTIDDEGEGPEEALGAVRALLEGGLGPPDFDASSVTVREGEIVAATLVTEFRGEALIAYSLTAPAWRRQGLARAGLLRAMHSLKQAGRFEVNLAVTRGNTPGERLYGSLGFVDWVG